MSSSQRLEIPQSIVRHFLIDNYFLYMSFNLAVCTIRPIPECLCNIISSVFPLKKSKVILWLGRGKDWNIRNEYLNLPQIVTRWKKGKYREMRC